jgi:hypothetical protein
MIFAIQMAKIRMFADVFLDYSTGIFPNMKYIAYWTSAN